MKINDDFFVDFGHFQEGHYGRILRGRGAALTAKADAIPMLLG